MINFPEEQCVSDGKKESERLFYFSFLNTFSFKMALFLLFFNFFILFDLTFSFYGIYYTNGRLLLIVFRDEKEKIRKVLRFTPFFP